jgi:hypothetical protein
VSVERASCALSVVYWQPDIYLAVYYLLQSLVRPVKLYNKCRESYHSVRREDIYG